MISPSKSQQNGIAYLPKAMTLCGFQHGSVHPPKVHECILRGMYAQGVLEYVPTPYTITSAKIDLIEDTPAVEAGLSLSSLSSGHSNKSLVWKAIPGNTCGRVGEGDREGKAAYETCVYQASILLGEL